MVTGRSRLRRLYGAGPLHLLIVLASFALAAYAVSRLGLGELWNPDVWWKSILVWFLGAVLLHDAVLFPATALADRLLTGLLRRSRGARDPARVSPLNHIRVPALAVGLLFLLFLPGIIEQGAPAYARATGQTQEPFLERWLILSAAICALSAASYAVRMVRARRGTAVPSRGRRQP